MIFKDSMNAKIKSLGYVVFIFVTISIVYYEIVIVQVSNQRGVFEQIKVLKEDLMLSSNEESILEMIKEVDGLYETIKDDA